jgi:hypothetical protein
VVQAITQQIQLLKWDLATVDDLLTAFKELTQDHGYRGGISYAVTVESSDTKIYVLQFGVDESTSVTARLGDVIVLLGGSLEAMSQAEYDTKYGATP